MLRETIDCTNKHLFAKLILGYCIIIYNSILKNASDRHHIINVFRPFSELRLRHPLPIQSLKRFSTKKSDGPETKTPEDNISQPPEKQNVFKRLKQLTKEYWHILIPVHLVTSIGWVTVFFIAAKK